MRNRIPVEPPSVPSARLLKKRKRMGTGHRAIIRRDCNYRRATRREFVWNVQKPEGDFFFYRRARFLQVTRHVSPVRRDHVISVSLSPSFSFARYSASRINQTIHDIRARWRETFGRNNLQRVARITYFRRNTLERNYLKLCFSISRLSLASQRKLKTTMIGLELRWNWHRWLRNRVEIRCSGYIQCC